MKKLVKKIFEFSLTLSVFCVIAAVILAEVNIITSRRIEQNKIAEANGKRQKVLPQAEKDSFKEEVIGGRRYFLGFDNSGGYAGVVFEVTGRGFGGPINITVGVDKENKISGIAISKLDQSETPGLGIKITTPKFQDQFIGKVEGKVKLKRDGGEIDAITAATISSRAVVKAVEEGLRLYKEVASR